MFGLLPLLDRGRDAGRPVYRQLYDFIREEIELGRLKAGDRLPSIRELAGQLSLSKNTISDAYQQLAAEGYIESRARSGLYVAVDEAPLRLYRTRAETKLELSEDFISQGNGDSFLEAELDFTSGPNDLAVFPVDLWKKCLLEALHAPGHAPLGYGAPQGDFALREQLSIYLRQSRGIDCTPEQLFISAGTQLSLGLLCQLLPLIGQTVAMEDPGFAGTQALFDNFQCRMRYVPLDEHGIQPDLLNEEPEIRAVYVTPAHQFPLGMVMPVQRRYELLQWASDRNAYIIEDDYDSEFRYQGEPIPALKALDQEERVVYLGTLSKIFLPSVRISYMAVPRPLAAAFQKRIKLINQPVSPLIQHAVQLFFRHGHFERHVRRMKKLYKAKHAALQAAITEHLREYVTVLGQNAGLHLLIRLDPRITSPVKKARAAGVRIEPVTNHYSGHDGAYEHLHILSFGALNIVEMQDGVKRLAAAWRT